MTVLLALTLLALGSLAGFFVRFLLDRLTEDSETDLTDIAARLLALEQAEAVREATTIDALDRFDRLYKRMAARQSREDARESKNGHSAIPEPDLTFRERVRAQRGLP